MARRVNEGDLFGVQLREGRTVVGIVLHLSSIFTGCALVGFFSQVFESPGAVDISSLSGPFIWANYTAKLHLSRGDWPTLGQRKDLLAQAALPVLRAAYDLYYKDEIIGHVDMEHYRDFREFTVSPKQAMELRLSDILDQNGELQT